MPRHRKPTHRPKILAAALGAAVTVSGVAFAAQVEQAPVRSAPEPRVTFRPSTTPTSVLPSVPDDHGAPVVRPSRSPDQQRPRLEKSKDRRGRGEEASDRASRRPSPSRAPETAPSASPPTPTGSASSATPSPATATLPAGAEGILGGTNAARADAGLPSLRVDACLAQMAQSHARRLAAAGSLYHQDLGAVMGSCGTSAAGENVAMNYSAASDMVDQWLGSAGHRANLLNGRFTLIGIGVAQAPDGAWYGVQVFGDR